MQETWVQPLGPEDSPEEEMATHSGILCLENSMDRGAWWATVPGVTKSWTHTQKKSWTWLSNWARLYIPILVRALTAHNITSPGWLKQKLLRDTWELTLLLRGPLPPPLQDTASAAHIYDPWALDTRCLELLWCSRVLHPTPWAKKLFPWGLFTKECLIDRPSLQERLGGISDLCLKEAALTV